MDVSTYITKLLEQHTQPATEQVTAREAWLADGRKQYTPEVCERTLQLNEEFPIHEE